MTHQGGKPITVEEDAVVLNLIHACDERISKTLTATHPTETQMGSLVITCARYVITRAIDVGYLSGDYVVIEEN